MTLVKKNFVAKGTSCLSCERLIKERARKIKGVKEIEFDHITERGFVVFNDEFTSLDKVLSTIGGKNYICSPADELTAKNKNSIKTFGWAFAIIGLFVVAYYGMAFVERIQLPELTPTMSYGLLFVFGILTGFHCIGMCGGFVVSYTADEAKKGRFSYRSHLSYGFGKVVSYTVIGGIFGLIGSVFVFTPLLRGVVGLLAGMFLIIYGLSILNIFPRLKKIRFQAPKSLMKFAGHRSEHSSPLVIGLLNGLMIACGPLQAMYILAAGTGSLVQGATILFVFGLGTLPVMIGFGLLAGTISSRTTATILKVSGILVIVIGLFMINNGLALTGTGLDIGSFFGSSGGNISSSNTTQQGYQEIHMAVLASGWQPDTFTLVRGVPVHWIIDGKQLTGCNRAIQVPEYNLSFDIQPGLQAIEFTPTKAGTILWSCWMGMIHGKFIVVDK